MLIVRTERVLVDGPSQDSKLATARSSIPLANALLAPIKIEKLPRGARTPTVAKLWASSEVDKQWAETNWAKKKAIQEKRKSLTDFERESARPDSVRVWRG